MKEHPLFPWDHFSDQPCIIRDKKFKRMMYRRAALQMLKSGLLLLLLPFFIVIQLCKKASIASKVNRCIGLSVHVETECEGKHIVPLALAREFVNELGVQQLLVRIPLSDSENFPHYIEHIEALTTGGREVSVNIVQNRLILDSPTRLKCVLEELIRLLKGKTEYIHVGNAYNRRKWAFYHFGEYFTFYQLIRSITKKIDPNMKLIGGSVIDFELPPMLESLFHFRRGHYDGYGVQLYVDRRGAPENTQAGFNFLSKINLIEVMRQWSWKARGPLWISEINWPLKDTDKFSPCKGSVLVDEQTQADYLARAYLLAMASGRIRTCFWHQLVAPGYGLIDNRSETPKKRDSFYAFKTLNTLFNEAEVIRFCNGSFQGISGVYSLLARVQIDGKHTLVQALWSNSGDQEISLPEVSSWLSQSGEKFEQSSRITVGASVIYALTPE